MAEDRRLANTYKRLLLGKQMPSFEMSRPEAVLFVPIILLSVNKC